MIPKWNLHLQWQSTSVEGMPGTNETENKEGMFSCMGLLRCLTNPFCKVHAARRSTRMRVTLLCSQLPPSFRCHQKCTDGSNCVVCGIAVCGCEHDPAPRRPLCAQCHERWIHGRGKQVALTIRTKRLQRGPTREGPLTKVDLEAKVRGGYILRLYSG